MKTCEDCGCRVYNGICSNCKEELYIYETQFDDMIKPISDAFMKRVTEQMYE